MSLVIGTLRSDGSLTPGSMAEAIDNELQNQVPRGANEDPKARRHLAVAIATGVVGHLKANHDSFTVNIGTGGTNVKTVDIA
jgi:hypothetical protein